MDKQIGNRIVVVIIVKLHLGVFQNANLKDITTVFQYETCYSVHTITWLYVILGYKVMILLAGCFVAGQTRGVNKRFLQETRCLSAALYSWLVFVVTGLPLAFYYKEKINAFAAVVSVCVVLPNTATLCLVCVPQVSGTKICPNFSSRIDLVALFAVKLSVCQLLRVHFFGKNPNPDSESKNEFFVSLTKSKKGL